MSGIFGLIHQDETIVKQTLPLMAQTMCHYPWCQIDTITENKIGLGRIGIGIFNARPQPIWNATQTIALFMAGEIYLPNSLVPISEELVLARYEQFGEDFIKHIEGAFVVAILDKPRHQLIITNDRFGLYPLHYAHYRGRFIFAPEIKAILADTNFERKLDMTALAQYMRFQHLLGERTFFENVELLPKASLLNYDLTTDSWRIKPYWSFADIPYYPKIKFEEAVEETGRLMRLAVERLSSGTQRPGVYLSGGLDSRTILGLVKRRPIVSLNYGTKNCRDVYYAHKIAQTIGSEYYWFDLPNGEWVKEFADTHLNLTEGYHSWIHAHGISTLSRARQLIDVNLSGWDGGTIMGDSDTIEPLQYEAVDEAALATRLFYLFTQKFTWPSINEPEKHLLFCNPIFNQIYQRDFESFNTELAKYFDYRPDVRAGYFYIDNHCRRLTMNMIIFARSHIEARFPFFDYNFFDFIHALPAPLRKNRVLYRAVIQRETPQLAYIPYDHDEFLPTTRLLIRKIQKITIKLKRRFNRHIFQIFSVRPTLYVDYEGYLRHELREWAENILFDHRTAERGIFNPVFLHTLMRRHLSGLEEWTIGKIAPIITYEMMLRRFYD